MEERAWIVVDLGFGDAGKGLVTDFLVRKGARTVVRFNGGAQAGHNVVTPDGRHHTFAQLGAGAFVPGVRTFLSRYMVVHPTALLVESERLAEKGVVDPLARVEISESALVTTPFHTAANQLRERARGAGAHGSCGIGHGETVMDSLACSDAVRMRDLARPAALARTLRAIQERKRAELDELVRAFPEHAGALVDPQIVDGWLRKLAALRVAIVGDERLEHILETERVVFEGAQGVLLDEWRGFHPHTTWSTCTPDNARALLRGRDAEVIGVIRTFATRHGNGPLPTEDPALAFRDPNNVHGPWQGTMRFGHLDAMLLRYAIDACGGVDALALTHLDYLDRMEWRACVAYESADRELFAEDRLRLGPFQDLVHQERITRALEAAKPIYRALDRTKPIEAIEALLERPVCLTSSGPRSSDVRDHRAVIDR